MKQTTKPEQAKHRSKIGGQALIEGVMMKGVHTGAMACRLPDGTIDVETWEEHNGKEMPWYRKCPFVRGSFNFVISMRDGYRCLMKSAEKQMTEEEKENEPQEEMNRFERWLNDKLGDKVFGIIMSISMVIGVAFAVFAFIFLPKFLIGLLITHTAIPDDSRFVRSLLEGVLKIIIFLGYMAFTGCMKDIRRTYEYHGAEHKTIACLPLTVVWQRVLVSILLLPLVVGISYEFIRIAGRSDSWITRALSFPGLQIQRITTREPDASQIECAIAALKPCIPDNLEEDEW